jgi:hypothetical protein
MPSIGSSYAQKTKSSSFLVGVSNGYTGGGIAYSSAFTLPSTFTIPTSVLTRTQLEAILGGTPVEISTQRLYKDMGRQIVVYLDDFVGSPYRSVYRECHRMNSEQSEGVDGNDGDNRIFIKVFSSAGVTSTIPVARIG